MLTHNVTGLRHCIIFLLRICQLFFLLFIITINCCIVIAALVANKVSYIYIYIYIYISLYHYRYNNIECATFVFQVNQNQIASSRLRRWVRILLLLCASLEFSTSIYEVYEVIKNNIDMLVINISLKCQRVIWAYRFLDQLFELIAYYMPILI